MIFEGESLNLHTPIYAKRLFKRAKFDLSTIITAIKQHTVPGFEKSILPIIFSHLWKTGSCSHMKHNNSLYNNARARPLHRAVAYVSWSVNIPTRLHPEPATVRFNSHSIYSLKTMVHQSGDPGQPANCAHF